VAKTVQVTMLPTFPIAVVLVCPLPEVVSHRQSVWEWHDYHGSSRVEERIG